MKNDEWMHRETLTKVGVLDIGEAGGGAITACLKPRMTQITRLFGMNSQIRHCPLNNLQGDTL